MDPATVTAILVGLFLFIVGYILTQCFDSIKTWAIKKLEPKPTVEEDQEPQLIEDKIVDRHWTSVLKEKGEIPDYSYHWKTKDSEETVLAQGKLKTFYLLDAKNNTKQKVIMRDTGNNYMLLMYKDVHTTELYMELLKFCKDNPDLTKTGAAVTAAEAFFHSSENSLNNTEAECIIAMKKLAAAGYIILPPQDGPMIYGHSDWCISIEGEKQIKNHF